MITLYKNRERKFDNNGLGILTDTLKAEIREELNGDFTLELEYLLEDRQKLSNSLVRGNIVKCSVGDSREPQLFRINRTIKNLQTVSVFAQHIAISDLSKNFIKDTNIVGKTRIEALRHILRNTMEEHSFTATGDSTSQQDNLRIVRYNPIQAIMGTEDNTLLNRYGGEIEFNNFTVRVTAQRGQDKGVLIAYGKNITGIEEEIDDADLSTCIIPQGSNGLFIPEYCIKSSYINSYEKIYFKHMEFGEIGIVEPTEDNKGVTREEAIEKLKQVVKHLYDVEKVDMPSCNYRVNFLELSKTEEYKNYAVLEKVALGDTVTIRHSNMGIHLKARVNITTYDVLADRYKEIELGFKKKDLTGIINETQKQIQFTKDKIEMGITNLDETLSTKLTITESEISTEVKDVKRRLESSITQTAGEIRSDVRDLSRNTNSSIKQLSDEIDLRVTKDRVISAINLSSEGVKIQGNKISISGFVTFTDLNDAVDDRPTYNDLSRNGRTTIHGGNITTGTIDGNRIKANTTIECDRWKAGFGNLSPDRDLYPNAWESILLNIDGKLWVGNSINATHISTNSLNVVGSKNCVQKTDNYGWRAINAYETAEYYFGDMGFGQLVNGECKIPIDPVFSEIVNVDTYYHVFLSKYGKGDIWVVEQTENYFIVKGDSDIRFSWELKAKRRGYEDVRLKEVTGMMENDLTNKDNMEYKTNLDSLLANKKLFKV